MRLRTKLALAFALVAAVPLLGLTFPARRALRDSFEQELASRLDVAARASELSLTGLARDADRAAQDLSQGELIQELAQSLHDQTADPSQVVRLGERLMTSRGVDVLEVIDASGRVLTSGHLPARAGDPDPQGLALARAGGPSRLIEIEVRGDAGIQRALAYVAGRPVDHGSTRLFVLAGRQLDKTFADHLASLTGAEVAIRGADGVQVRSSSALEGARVRARIMPLGTPGGTLALRLSAEGLHDAQAHLLSSAFALAGVALALAALLGWLLALRITRPVDALAEGSRALARGELGHRVDARASGEVGELVRTFNAMAGDLQGATERAAVAERIAAWQEVARRLAHEIKNPLTPIRMSVETLQQAFAKRRPDFEEIFSESSRAVLEEVDRLKRIVDEFSRFARLPHPQLAPIDLAELVGQVLGLYGGSKMAIRRELTSPFPAVLADRDQLTQVLVNLLQNAEQAMEGGGTCTVRVREGAADEAIIEVEDTGPGVPEAERHRIFEPYFTTKEDGSGLGLAIAQRIVAEHGGKLEVLAPPAGGACFRISLPTPENEGAAGAPRSASGSPRDI